VRDGAEAITTNCGFLALFQAELAAAVEVPVATSSLLQAAMIQATLPPGRCVGVLTIAQAALSAEHLAAAGVPAGTPVEGTDAGRELTRAILGDEPALDVEAARADVLDAGDRLLARHPEVAALVLECTNMAPYAAALQDRTGLPVLDIVSLATWLQAGLRPRRFPPPAPGWR
jgi:Asp/Glu/hydantoin racemase